MTTTSYKSDHGKGDDFTSIPRRRARLDLRLQLYRACALIPVAFAGLLLHFFVLQPVGVGRYLSYLVESANFNPEVALRQGIAVGTTLHSDNYPVPLNAWLGIPYAQPPVGDLRFSKPLPVRDGDEKFQAIKYGFRCPGRQVLEHDGIPQLEADEDCLTANVFKQKTYGSSKGGLPVMVYFHGGAYNLGHAAMHDTAAMLAWSSEPFLAISFNYRLGALGFLNSDVTAAQGLLNVGLRDQVLLLEWVNQNAASFGGNPDDVTVVGVSAGAHSIGHHIVNGREQRRLFHKAVMESGSPTSRAVHPPNSSLHRAQFESFVIEAGCSSSMGELLLACLRQAPSEVIVAAQLKVFDEWAASLRWAWQPVLDNDIISRRPLDTWESGHQHRLPLLTGFNHNEGSVFVDKKMSTGEEFSDFFAALLPHLDSRDLAKLDEVYPNPAQVGSSPYRDTRDLAKLGCGQQFKRLEAAYGQYAYVCPVRQTAAAAAAAAAPVYLYHWVANNTAIGGASHGDQVRYETMDLSRRAVSPTHDVMACLFNAYLTSFIVSGDPNAVRGRMPDRPHWAKYHSDAAETRRAMVLGLGNDEGAGGSSTGSVAKSTKDDWAQAECEFWNRIGERVEEDDIAG